MKNNPANTAKEYAAETTECCQAFNVCTKIYLSLPDKMINVSDTL